MKGIIDRLPPALRRFAWFVLLWVAGVAAVGTVAFGIRLWLR